MFPFQLKQQQKRDNTPELLITDSAPTGEAVTPQHPSIPPHIQWDPMENIIYLLLEALPLQSGSNSAQHSSLNSLRFMIKKQNGIGLKGRTGTAQSGEKMEFQEAGITGINPPAQD